MHETQRILDCWAASEAAGEPAVLATVVKVDGSAYRRPGARLVLSHLGLRAGSVSGGCLEGDIARRAWHLTAGGPCVRVYDTRTDEEGAAAFGLGCNGVVRVLLQRLAPGEPNPAIDLLRTVRAERRPAILATVVGVQGASVRVGDPLALPPDGPMRSGADESHWAMRLLPELEAVRTSGRSRLCSVDLEGGPAEVFIECLAPPVRLLVVGAGDDARPVARLAAGLGWQVVVADGRSHLATRSRFPEADDVVVIGGARDLEAWSGDPRTAAVILTHSVDQDAAALAALLPSRLPYVGVLGPRRRTESLLAHAGLPPAPEWPTLHSPVGLDLGAETPDEIALSILAEVQATMAGRAAQALRSRSGPIHAASVAA